MEPGRHSAVPLSASNSLAPEQHLAIALHSLTRQLGRRPEVADYRELRERDPSLPCFSEIYAAYGTWSTTLTEAGLTEADEQSPVWRDVLVGPEALQMDISRGALLELADQVHLLQEVADEQGIDLWAETEWLPDEPEPAWADQPLTRDSERD